MVLLQIPIYGYLYDVNSIMNGHIYTSVSVPFFGKYKIKFLGYSINWTTAPPSTGTTNILRIQSTNLFTNATPAKLYIVADATTCIFYSNNLEFTSNLNGVIDIDILNAYDDAIPTNFMYCLLNFDLEKLD